MPAGINVPEPYFAVVLAFAGFFTAARLRALACVLAGFTDVLEAAFTDGLAGALGGVGTTSSRLRRSWLIRRFQIAHPN